MLGNVQYGCVNTKGVRLYEGQLYLCWEVSGIAVCKYMGHSLGVAWLGFFGAADILGGRFGCRMWVSSFAHREMSPKIRIQGSGSTVPGSCNAAHHSGERMCTFLAGMIAAWLVKDTLSPVNTKPAWSILLPRCQVGFSI